MVQVNVERASSGDAHERVLLHPDLFAWTGRDVVLMLEQRDGRWIVARGWRGVDELRHVRRWTFASAAAAASQIRRLVRDANGDATAASGAVSRWVELASRDQDLVARECP